MTFLKRVEQVSSFVKSSGSKPRLFFFVDFTRQVNNKEIFYFKGFEPRKAKCGEPLPLERPLRTSLLPEARIPDQVFTQLVTHFLVFFVSDILSLHDTGKFYLFYY